MASGRSHLRIVERYQGSDAQCHRNETDEPQLAIAQFNEFAKRLAPDAGRGEREKAFDDQKQRKGRPQRIHKGATFGRRYFAGVRDPRPVPYCLKYWKNSALGSRTRRSLLFLNVDL